MTFFILVNVVIILSYLFTSLANSNILGDEPFPVFKDEEERRQYTSVHVHSELLKDLNKGQSIKKNIWRFELSVRLNPCNATLWNDLGAANMHIDHFNDAYDCFLTALELDSSLSPARKNRDAIVSFMRKHGSSLNGDEKRAACRLSTFSTHIQNDLLDCVSNNAQYITSELAPKFQKFEEHNSRAYSKSLGKFRCHNGVLDMSKNDFVGEMVCPRATKVIQIEDNLHSDLDIKRVNYYEIVDALLSGFFSETPRALMLQVVEPENMHNSMPTWRAGENQELGLNFWRALTLDRFVRLVSHGRVDLSLYKTPGLARDRKYVCNNSDYDHIETFSLGEAVSIIQETITAAHAAEAPSKDLFYASAEATLSLSSLKPILKLLGTIPLLSSLQLQDLNDYAATGAPRRHVGSIQDLDNEEDVLVPEYSIGKHSQLSRYFPIGYTHHVYEGIPIDPLTSAVFRYDTTMFLSDSNIPRRNSFNLELHHQFASLQALPRLQLFFPHIHSNEDESIGNNRKFSQLFAHNREKGWVIASPDRVYDFWTIYVHIKGNMYARACAPIHTGRGSDLQNELRDYHRSHRFGGSTRESIIGQSKLTSLDADKNNDNLIPDGLEDCGASTLLLPGSIVYLPPGTQLAFAPAPPSEHFDGDSGLSFGAKTGNGIRHEMRRSVNVGLWLPLYTGPNVHKRSSADSRCDRTQSPSTPMSQSHSELSSHIPDSEALSAAALGFRIGVDGSQSVERAPDPAEITAIGGNVEWNWNGEEGSQSVRVINAAGAQVLTQLSNLNADGKDSNFLSPNSDAPQLHKGKEVSGDEHSKSLEIFEGNLLRTLRRCWAGSLALMEGSSFVAGFPIETAADIADDCLIAEDWILNGALAAYLDEVRRCFLHCVASGSWSSPIEPNPSCQLCHKLEHLVN